MATFTKTILSQSTNGKGIKVASNATPGTQVHTAVSGTNDFDEIWIYVYNSDVSSVTLNLELGGVSDPDNIVSQSIPGKAGLYLVLPGLVMNNGASIAAYASSSNKLVIYGYVNRITS